jgi:hypothetical protein
MKAIQNEQFEIAKDHSSRAVTVVAVNCHAPGWVGVTLQLSQTWVAGSRVFDLSNLVTFH